MSDELFQRSIKITTSLIEQIGEPKLQSACAKLSAQCGGDTSKVTQSANPERDLDTSMQSKAMDDAHADVQAIYDVSYALDICRQRHLRWTIRRMQQQAAGKHCQLADMLPSSFH